MKPYLILLSVIASLLSCKSFERSISSPEKDYEKTTTQTIDTEQVSKTKIYLVGQETKGPKIDDADFDLVSVKSKKEAQDLFKKHLKDIADKKGDGSRVLAKEVMALVFEKKRLCHITGAYW